MAYRQGGATTPHIRRNRPQTEPIEVRIYNAERRIEGYRRDAQKAERMGWGQYRVDHALKMAAWAEGKLAELLAEAEGASK
jgi:hypothetical protein